MRANRKPPPEQLALLELEPGAPPAVNVAPGSAPAAGLCLRPKPDPDAELLSGLGPLPDPGALSGSALKPGQLMAPAGFAYLLVRSPRRTLAIHVRGGQVEVRAPLKASQPWIQDFLAQKSAWILRKLSEQEQRERQKLVIAAGHHVAFLGQPRYIEVVRAPRAAVELQDERLLLFAPEPSPKRLESLFHRWLQRQAREYMGARSVTIARQLGVEAKLKDVVFRKTRSKWGHCQRDGTIQYNWLVMMAPREVVDYLVAHECSHLRHMNHSKAFWDTVASVCPDWKARRQWLKDHGHRLWTEL